VRRLRILRELKAEDDSIIRDIELRRGLNVIWSPPHQPDAENGLFQDGVSGHTAGKTTLCRLIRHVLGEQGFAADSTRRLIREKLPSGWVVAEILVGEVPWAVARPFAVGPHSFCIRNGTVDQTTDGTDRSDYQIFLDAVRAGTVGLSQVSRYPSSNEQLEWSHFLPWLSRDQECRFADFLEWRHPSSNSDSPSRSVDDRQFIVRTMLALLSNDEHTELQRNATLVAQKQEAARREPLLKHQAAVEHSRLSRLLNTQLPAISEPLFASRAKGILAERAETLSRQERELQSQDRRMQLQSLLEQAVVAESNARRNLEDHEGRLNVEESALASLSGASQTSLLAELPPARDYCNVPIALAREKGCPLACGRPTDISSMRSERTAAEELQIQQERIGSLRTGLTERRRLLEEAIGATNKARRDLLSESTHFDERRGKLLEEKAQLGQLVQLADEAEMSWNEASNLAASLEKLDQEIEQSRKRQEQLRSNTLEALGRFSARFDYVVRAFLGDEASGRVDTSGRSIALSVEQQGVRESAAITTIKLLAFDLATLTISIEGQGAFPRFLLHDGPREADLAPDVYERLFFFAHELEKCFSGEPSFQYIVATTTPPPPTYQSSPWLRVKLAGAPTEERLLRCDL
jgi:hypothetical protein